MQSYSIIAILLLLFIICPCSQQSENRHNSSEHLRENECYTWMYRVNSNNDTSPCICGDDHHHEILCDSTSKEVYISDGLAMTYDNDTKHMIAGPTIYGWTSKSLYERDKVYRKVKQNKLEVNQDMCGDYHRAGQLCGKCQDGYVRQVYSYDFHCKKCPTSALDDCIFIITTFIPLTLFYIFIIVFKFNANSPSIHAYILAVQLLYSPQIIRFYSIQYDLTRMEKIFIIAYEVWNLDFVSAFDTTFCMKLSTLQTLVLGYVPPCYLLLLIVVTYLVIKLHSRGCKLMIWTNSLLKNCCNCFKIKWQYKASTIDVFATVLLLSYNKLLSTHFDILVYMEPFNERGIIVGKYLYYDPTVPYFIKGHLLYGILAVVLATLSTLLPFLLLLFYPTKCFQKCLNSLKINRYYGLHIFVDSFTGCYKDGTESGTRDCRYFAAFFLLLRILTYIILAALPTTCAIATNGTIIMIFMAIFVACQPYRAKFDVYNRITGIMLATMSAAHMTLLGLLLSRINRVDYVNFNLLVLAVLTLLPQIYITVLALRWICFAICISREEHTPLLHNSPNHYGV